MSNEQKITNDIKVPNKDLEALRINFPHCFDKDGNFLLEKFKNNLTEKEINFSTESYGLDWLGKSYARLLASDPATTLLKADETHNIKPGNADAENLLIKGDNLEVLKHLANAYYEKVKMIYIDPPYNTGSDGFVYNDDRKFTVRELQQLIGVDAEKAKRILSFTQSHSNSHSAWLTFMYPRLYIAKQLLKDDGVIFVSIDDNEVAQLRLMMDEVFGEENFVAELIWEKKYSPQNDAKWFSVMHDYVLVCAKDKDKWRPYLLSRTEEMNARYANPDNDERGDWKASDMSVKSYSANYDYEITLPSGRIVSPPKGRCWSFSIEKYEEMVMDDRIWFGADKNGVPSVKKFLTEVKQGLVPSTFMFRKDVGDNEEARKEVKAIFNAAPFDTPKPSRLIKRILELTNDAYGNNIILDFFAGSGTTGDAVMQLNAEDGGNRKYILVQIPEAIDPKKNKAAFDFVKDELKAEPTIFEITKERLVRAAKKVNAQLDEKAKSIERKIKELEGQSKMDLIIEELNAKNEELKSIDKLKAQNCFKVFETMPIWEDYNFEAEEFNAQQVLFDADKLSEDDIKALLTTWKTYDGIALTQKLENSDLGGYTAYYGQGRLYLMKKGFTTDSLKALLEKIDTDKHFEPKSIIAFGHHFDSARLRELSENVKTYNNKKKSDLDFITRY